MHTRNCMTPYRHRIVVALDLSEYAEIVLDHAIDQAIHHAAPDLHFLTVVEDRSTDVEDVKSKLAALVVPALDGLPCDNWRIRLHVRAGKPPEEIANLAAEVGAHLLVIGRFGVHHPRRRIGLVASRVIDRATCPTYVVALTDQVADATTQCPDCVAARTESDGERWFCDAHRAPDRMRLSTLVDPGGTWVGGGPMW
jgi:nucleotide-binding universal stress UspA family protein